MIKVSLEPTQWIDAEMFHDPEFPSEARSFSGMPLTENLEPDLEVEILSSNPALDLSKLSRISGFVNLSSHTSEKAEGKTKDRYFIPLSSLPELTKTFGSSIYYKTPQHTIFELGEPPEEHSLEDALDRMKNVIKSEGLLYLNDAPLLSGLRLTAKYIMEIYKKTAAKKEVNTLIVCREEDVLPTYLYMLNEMRARKGEVGPVDEVQTKFNQVMLCHTNGMTMEQRDAMYIDFFDATKGIMIVSINTFNTDFESITSFDYRFLVFSGIINYLEEDLKHVKTITEMFQKNAKNRGGARILIDTEDVTLKPEKLYDVLTAVDPFYVRAYLGERKNFVREFTKGGEVFKSSEPRNFEKLRKILRNILLREVPISGAPVPAEKSITEFIPLDLVQKTLLKEFKGKRGFSRMSEIISLDPGILTYEERPNLICKEICSVLPGNYAMSNATKYIIRKVKEILQSDEKVLIEASNNAERDYIAGKLTKSLQDSIAKYGDAPVVLKPKDIKRAVKWYNEANKPVVIILTDGEIKKATNIKGNRPGPRNNRELSKKEIYLKPEIISPYVIRYSAAENEILDSVRYKVLYNIQCVFLTDEHKNAIYALEEYRRKMIEESIGELRKLEGKSDMELLQSDSDLVKAFKEALSAREK